MGVNTDVKAPPFQPLPPKPGVPPSGIGGHPNIRTMANRARERVSARQRTFMNMVTDNVTVPETAPGTESQQQYLKMGMELSDSRELIDRFIDWVLFK